MDSAWPGGCVGSSFANMFAQVLQSHVRRFRTLYSVTRAEKRVIKPRSCQSRDTNAGFSCGCYRSRHPSSPRLGSLLCRLNWANSQSRAAALGAYIQNQTDKLGPPSPGLLRPAHMEISLSSICISKYPGALPLVFPSAGRSRVLLVRINSLWSMKCSISRRLHVAGVHSHTRRTLQLKPLLTLLYSIIFNSMSWLWWKDAQEGGDGKEYLS